MDKMGFLEHRYLVDALAWWDENGRLLEETERFDLWVYHECEHCLLVLWILTSGLL